MEVHTWRYRLKAKISHSLRGMLVECLFSATLIMLTLFIALFFRLILS